MMTTNAGDAVQIPSSTVQPVDMSDGFLRRTPPSSFHRIAGKVVRLKRAQADER